MVRTVKAKTARSLNKGETAVLFPGPTRAEPWEAWILGAPDRAECMQICARPGDNPLRKNATLALPVSQVFCLPLWLNETDPRQFAGMIPLQLELRGLQPRGASPAVFDWSVVDQEGSRTLVMVGVLPGSLAEELQIETPANFDLSARYLAFPENALTLWREQDCLAVAITRGRNLVYYQALAEGQITQRVLQDLNCILATLTMQGILVSLQRMVLWTEVSRPELTALQVTRQLPLSQEQRPPPQAPSPAWKLTPAIVHEARKIREIQRWRNRGLLIAFAVYLVLTACLLTRLAFTYHKVNEQRQWQAEHAQAISLVHDTQAAWKDLQPVVDEDSYPFELLLHCTQAIPADQLYLTLFEVNNGHLLIKAEAKNIAAAFQYQDNLKKDPFFTGYTWEMGQPHVLPNDLAQLQIDGTRAATN